LLFAGTVWTFWTLDCGIFVLRRSLSFFKRIVSTPVHQRRKSWVRGKSSSTLKLIKSVIESVVNG
jgi:hypothetical protein